MAPRTESPAETEGPPRPSAALPGTPRRESGERQEQAGFRLQLRHRRKANEPGCSPPCLIPSCTWEKEQSGKQKLHGLIPAPAAICRSSPRSGTPLADWQAAGVAGWRTRLLGDGWAGSARSAVFNSSRGQGSARPTARGWTLPLSGHPLHLEREHKASSRPCNPLFPWYSPPKRYREQSLQGTGIYALNIHLLEIGAGLKNSL